MDDEWVEEEVTVFLDYQKAVTAAEITDPELQFKIIGLEGPQIISEINGKVFSGSYSEPMGTLLFFSKNEGGSKSDNVFEPNDTDLCKLEAMANKVIMMKRQFVEPRITEEEGSPEVVSHSYEVEQTYQEALDGLLQPDTLPPRTVADVLDNKIHLKRDLSMEIHLE